MVRIFKSHDVELKREVVMCLIVGAFWISSVKPCQKLFLAVISNNFHWMHWAYSTAMGQLAEWEL